MKEKLKSPFKISCQSGYKDSQSFNFANLIDNDRAYYYLNGDVGSCVVNRCDGKKRKNSNQDLTILKKQKNSG